MTSFLPESYPDQILDALRVIESRHLAPTLWPRSPRQLIADLLRSGGGRFFVAHENRRKLIPMGALKKELSDVVAYPVNDKAWGKWVIFWDHKELPFLLRMQPWGWEPCKNNGEPLVMRAAPVSERRAA